MVERARSPGDNVFQTAVLRTGETDVSVEEKKETKKEVPVSYGYIRNDRLLIIS